MKTGKRPARRVDTARRVTLAHDDRLRLLKILGTAALGAIPDIEQALGLAAFGREYIDAQPRPSEWTKRLSAINRSTRQLHRALSEFKEYLALMPGFRDIEPKLDREAIAHPEPVELLLRYLSGLGELCDDYIEGFKGRPGRGRSTADALRLTALLLRQIFRRYQKPNRKREGRFIGTALDYAGVEYGDLSKLLRKVDKHYTVTAPMSFEIIAEVEARRGERRK